MSWFSDNFQFSSSQKRGTLFLLATIVVVQILIYITGNFQFKKSTIHFTELTQYQKVVDSLKQEKIVHSQPKIYPFNPNYLTEYRAYIIGLSATEFDRLQKFRTQNQFVNSAEDFQRVTGVHDTVLQRISPYFKFPDWVKNSTKNTQDFKDNPTTITPTKVTPAKSQPQSDLNTATKEQLVAINGIGEKLADRIITYRTKLQGYTFNDQLYEVWYLDKEVADKVLEKFTVIQKPVIQKININEADFKTVMKLPYMDYDLTKKIFNLRNAGGKINSMEQLKKIEGFPIDKFDRITLYLKTE